jgi:DNA-binding winged helix-turn-helix (wHTH) protein
VSTLCPCCGTTVADDRPLVAVRRSAVYFRGTRVRLQPRMAEILEALIAAHPEECPRQHIMDRVWGDLYCRDQTLEVHVSKLRMAVEPLGMRISARGKHAYLLEMAQ